MDVPIIHSGTGQVTVETDRSSQRIENAFEIPELNSSCV
jgi:hypothetical protein